MSPRTAARQASLSITNSQNSLELLSIELVMPINCLILCHSLLLLPSIFPSIRVFTNESALRIRWPKYWSFSISPSKEYSVLISFRMDWLDLLGVRGLSRVLSNTTGQKHHFFGIQPSSWLSPLAVSGDAGVSWPGEALSRSPPPSLHGLPHACVCVTFPLEKGRQPRGIRAHPTPVRLPPYQSHLPGPCLQIRSHPKSWSQDSMYEF